ncbi:MbnP family protein [Filimonas lacunae]|nr:MbnP family protein [Filimonas lacunae]
MRRNIRLLYFVLLFNCITTWPAAHLPAQRSAAPVQLHLFNTAGGKAIAAGDSCINQYHETFTVRNFRYYLSHIQLADSTGKFYEAGEAETYLVDFTDSSSQHITLHHQGKAWFIRFLLGVDSSKNVSGVHTGVLDPARGMYWTWNSGYVMAKLEGRSEQSTAPGRNFTYHIGGYKPQQQTARSITLALSPAVAASKDITLVADILQWFGGKENISIATHPICHEPGALAVSIADNYTRMFTVQEPVETEP